MATLDQLGIALKNADAAGDVNAARALASEIVKMRGGQAAQASPPAPAGASDLPPGAVPLPPTRSFVGDVNDVVRGLANAFTFGNADRIAAGAESATGIGGTQGDYAGNLANERAQTEQFNQAHPIGAAAINLAGSAAVPLGAIGAAAKGAGLGTKALYGALAGAGIGGVQGASQSPDFTNVPQTAKDAGVGALVGFGLGGAIPVAGAGIGKGYQAVANALRGNVSGMSRAASNHLIDAVTADTPAAVQAEVARLGPQAMLSDAGPALLGKAQGASLNSDEGRSVLQKALTQRNTGTNARVMSDVERALGPAEDPQTVTDTINATRAAVDAKNYPKALSNAPAVDTTPVLAQLGPAIGNSVGMEQKALTNLRGMLMTEKPFPVVDPVTGRQMIANGVPVTEMRTVPQDNPAILHKIKGEIDNVIQYDQPGLGVPAGAVSRQQGALKQFRGALNAALEQQVPGYAEANAASAALAKRAEAVEAGTQMLSSGKTTPSPGRFAGQFEPMAPGEKIALAKGVRGRVEQALGTKINDLQALRQELQGEGGWNTAKLATVYGQDAADQLTNSVERNLKFRDTYNKVVENSQTAQRQAAANAMKPEPTGQVPLINPNMSLTGLIGAGAKRGVNAVADALRRDPTASYGTVAKALSAQGPARDRVLNAILDAMARRQQNSAVAPLVGNRAAVAAAILANDQMQNRLHSR